MGGTAANDFPTVLLHKVKLLALLFLFLFSNGNHVMQELGDDVVQTTFDFDPRVFL